MSTDVIHCGDCLELLPQYAGQVHLVFADPPYNIGYSYDVYHDRKGYDEYCQWTEKWIQVCADALTPTGSAYFMIGDDFAAETRLAVRKAGLTLRNWIVWSYSFGQCTKAKFGRSHVHIFYVVKNPKLFTFNETALRVPSMRGLVYNDARTDPRGRLPEDTWDCYPRVCGTFKARQGWHGCQLPEDLLARIITGSSRAGDVVLDPFAGSGTTLVAARRLGRRYVGLELSKEYVRQAEARLAALDEEAAQTTAGWPMAHYRELLRFYRETDYPLWAFENRKGAREHFTAVFNRRLGTKYGWEEVHGHLCRAKEKGELPVIVEKISQLQKDGKKRQNCGQRRDNCRSDAGRRTKRGNRAALRRR